MFAGWLATCRERRNPPKKRWKKKIDEPTHHQSPNEGVGFKGPLLGEDPILLELPYSILLWGWADQKKSQSLRPALLLAAASARCRRRAKAPSLPRAHLRVIWTVDE